MYRNAIMNYANEQFKHSAEFYAWEKKMMVRMTNGKLTQEELRIKNRNYYLASKEKILAKKKCRVASQA